VRADTAPFSDASPHSDKKDIFLTASDNLDISQLVQFARMPPKKKKKAKKKVAAKLMSSGEAIAHEQCWRAFLDKHPAYTIAAGLGLQSQSQKISQQKRIIQEAEDLIFDEENGNNKATWSKYKAWPTKPGEKCYSDMGSCTSTSHDGGTLWIYGGFHNNIASEDFNSFMPEETNDLWSWSRNRRSWKLHWRSDCSEDRPVCRGEQCCGGLGRCGPPPSCGDASLLTLKTADGEEAIMLFNPSEPTPDADGVWVWTRTSTRGPSPIRGLPALPTRGDPRHGRSLQDGFWTRIKTEGRGPSAYFEGEQLRILKDDGPGNNNRNCDGACVLLPPDPADNSSAAGASSRGEDGGGGVGGGEDGEEEGEKEEIDEEALAWLAEAEAHLGGTSTDDDELDALGDVARNGTGGDGARLIVWGGIYWGPLASGSCSLPELASACCKNTAMSGLFQLTFKVSECRDLHYSTDIRVIFLAQQPPD
jgi:hypothetical protein